MMSLITKSSAPTLLILLTFPLASHAQYGYGYGGGRGLYGGGVAGVVVGVIAVILICLFFMMFIRRRRRIASANAAYIPSGGATDMSTYPNSGGPASGYNASGVGRNGASGYNQGARANENVNGSPIGEQLPQYTKYEAPNGPPPTAPGAGNQGNAYQPPNGAPPTAPAPTYNPNTRPNANTMDGENGFVGGFRREQV